MPIRESTVEIIVTVTTIVALAVIVFFGSVYGARGLAEIYGDSNTFEMATLFAKTAYRWSPYLFATILIGYFWLRGRMGDRRWTSWCALSLASITTGLVFYGIVVPFASTTFRMGTH